MTNFYDFNQSSYASSVISTEYENMICYLSNSVQCVVHEALKTWANISSSTWTLQKWHKFHQVTSFWHHNKDSSLNISCHHKILWIALHNDQSHLLYFPKFITGKQFKNFQNAIYFLCCTQQYKSTCETFPLYLTVRHTFPFEICHYHSYIVIVIINT